MGEGEASTGPLVTSKEPEVRWIGGEKREAVPQLFGARLGERLGYKRIGKETGRV